jgi:S-adenosylmethionine-diacylglycerol 3-amino-3-carboxypropyl transferase
VHSNASPVAGCSTVRYAQVWEDADVLLAGLDVKPGDVCVSIASAGDNTLALLTRDPSRVIALDMNAAQLACLELRVAAFRSLAHPELLELVGSRPSARRSVLYSRCRPSLGASARRFWDRRPAAIEEGIGSSGKFERYLALFRRCVLPLIHDADTVNELLRPASMEVRKRFYDEHWNTRQWRLLFRVFFSRAVMGAFGRDAEFFRYVETDVPATILHRTRHALTELDPSSNPYVHWILTGTHGEALPCALRPEHFDTIRQNLDRLEWHEASLEQYLDDCGEQRIDRFNLSDVFEYVSPEHYEQTLRSIVRRSRPGARLAYWNMLVSRRRPRRLARQLRPLDGLARVLHRMDRAFFYSAFRLEEVQ